MTHTLTTMVHYYGLPIATLKSFALENAARFQIVVKNTGKSFDDFLVKVEQIENFKNAFLETLKSPVVIGTLKAQANVTFNRDKVMEFVNLHWLNQKNCNEVDDNGVLKPIDHPNKKELDKAHWNITVGHEFDVYADILSDGSITNIRTLK